MQPEQIKPASITISPYSINAFPVSDGVYIIGQGSDKKIYKWSVNEGVWKLYYIPGTVPDDELMPPFDAALEALS